jgi:hypothetical protein
MLALTDAQRYAAPQARPSKRLRNRLAQQRWRLRGKRQQAASWVDYSDRVLSMLIKRRYITEQETENKTEVRRALTLFLADIAAADQN